MVGYHELYPDGHVSAADLAPGYEGIQVQDQVLASFGDPADFHADLSGNPLAGHAHAAFMDV